MQKTNEACHSTVRARAYPATDRPRRKKLSSRKRLLVFQPPHHIVTSTAIFNSTANPPPCNLRPDARLAVAPGYQSAFHLLSKKRRSFSGRTLRWVCSCTGGTRINNRSEGATSARS